MTKKLKVASSLIVTALSGYSGSESYRYFSEKKGADRVNRLKESSKLIESTTGFLDINNQDSKWHILAIRHRYSFEELFKEYAYKDVKGIKDKFKWETKSLKELKRSYRDNNWEFYRDLKGWCAGIVQLYVFREYRNDARVKDLVNKAQRFCKDPGESKTIHEELVGSTASVDVYLEEEDFEKFYERIKSKSFDFTVNTAIEESEEKTKEGRRVYQEFCLENLSKPKNSSSPNKDKVKEICERKKGNNTESPYKDAPRKTYGFIHTWDALIRDGVLHW